MKKLYISMIFSNLVVEKQLSTIVTSMHNFIANFRKILDICKKHAGNLWTKNTHADAQIRSHSCIY